MCRSAAAPSRATVHSLLPSPNPLAPSAPKPPSGACPFSVKRIVEVGVGIDITTFACAPTAAQSTAASTAASVPARPACRIITAT